MKPPKRHRMKDVPKKLVIMFAESALPRCMVPLRYGPRFTAMLSVASLSPISTTLQVPFSLTIFTIHEDKEIIERKKEGKRWQT